MAAGLDEADVEEAAGGAIDEVVTLAWDPARDDLRQRTERRLGALVLASRDGRAPAGEATTAALVEQVRSTRLTVLRWRDVDRALQARIGFARRALGEDWPDVTDDALLASLDDWLAPRLAGATGRADLERIDLGRILRDLVGHHRVHELDRLVPTRRRRGERTDRARRLLGRAPGDRGAGPGPVRHHRPPGRGAGAGAPGRAPPVPRRPTGPGDLGPPGLLGRVVEGGPQGHGRALPQARLAPRSGRPHRRAADAKAADEP